MAELTIDELARTTGMTVRNVRSYQTRGLLPGPVRRGRAGYYDDEHVRRLQLIQELQAEGLPLRLVERLLANDADTAGRIMGLRRTVLAGFETPAEQVVGIDELQERFGGFDEETFQRAVALGAIVPQVDGTLRLPNPGLLETADAVVARGVPLIAALRVAQEVQAACADLAHTFVDMVRDEVWAPFDEAGRPEAQWPQVADTIQQIRPLANEIFAQLLPPAIAHEIERAFGEELRERAEDDDAGEL